MPEISEHTRDGFSSAGQKLQLENFFPFQLAVAAHLVSKGLADIFSRHELAMPEWHVLVTLGEFGAMTGKSISSRAHMHKTKVSRAVALLEGRKIISRSKSRDDLRESVLSLSKSGRAIYEELVPIVLSFEAQLLGALEAADRLALKRALLGLAATNAARS